MNSARPTLAATVFAGLASLAGTAAAQPLYDFVLIDSFNADPRRGEAYAWGVNDRGDVCGMATMDNVIGYPGFAWDEATGKTRLPISWPAAVNNAGLVVGNGQVFDLSTGEATTPPNLPGTYYGPLFNDVNEAGVAVGSISTCSCSDSGGVFRIPYVWDAAGGARTVDVPGSRGLVRVNNAGIALGAGFTVDLGTGAYTMLTEAFPSNVGVGGVQATDLNDAGVLVGWRAGVYPTYRYGFIWSPATGVEILPFLGAGFQRSVTPARVNNAGVVVGTITTELAEPHLFVYSSAEGLHDLSVGDLVSGKPAGYRFSTPTDISNTGWIVGYGHTAAGKITGFLLKPRTPSCPADFNGDGFLDFFDYSDFVGCFETSLCPSGKTADFNGDGFADFFDYDAFVSAFEFGC